MAACISRGQLGVCFLTSCTKSLKYGQGLHLLLRVPQVGIATNSHEANKQTASIIPESSSVGNASSGKVEKISKAMKAYLERAQAHNTFMTEEIAEYEIGKRHLANIMGVEADSFTQEDVDRAVEYLFPSGLFDKKSRPKFKHPTDILPKRKAAEFGMDGRPFNYLFYTGTPRFFGVLHELSLKHTELKKYEDSEIAKGIKLDSVEPLHLSGSQWMEKKALENKLQEKLSDMEYKGFLTLLDLIAHQPLANKEKEFIYQFRVDLQQQNASLELPPLLYDETGRGYQKAAGERKKARATVQLYENGTGAMSVNGKSLLEYFPRLADREQVIFPLQLTDKLNLVDFTAMVQLGGPSGQAGAIRLALSRALRSFVDKDTTEKMRLAGLLTRDPRMVERQKPGQPGARKKPTWKKR